MKTLKKKLTYDDIKLMGKVKMPYDKVIGEIWSITNDALTVGIDEPIFKVHYKYGETSLYCHFGLKYILKNYILEN